MPYKRMMFIAATVPLIFLLAFAAIPEFFVLKSYPSAEGLALEIGITYRTLCLVCYLWLCVLHFNQETLSKWITKKQFFWVLLSVPLRCVLSLYQ